MTLPQLTAAEIAELLGDFITGASSRVTDLSEGSVLRTITEAWAIEAGRLHLGIDERAHEAIETSAYTTFGFTRAPAERATGAITFVRADGATGTVTIPAASRVRVPSTQRVYETIEAAEMLSGANFVTVTVRCLVAGTFGNTAHHTITDLVQSIAGVGSVDNAKAFINGRDEETDAERRVRFRAFLRSLQRSTREAILYGVRQTRLLDVGGNVIDEVRKANTVEWKPGHIKVFVHNGDQSPSAELVAAAQLVLDGSSALSGYKGAGIKAEAVAASDAFVSISVQYNVRPGYLPATVGPQIEAALRAVFDGLEVGDGLKAETLRLAIGALAGVAGYSLLAPVVDQAATYDRIYVPVEPMAISYVPTL